MRWRRGRPGGSWRSMRGSCLTRGRFGAAGAGWGCMPLLRWRLCPSAARPCLPPSPRPRRPPTPCLPTRCREATQLARALAELHGGLPALLAATAGESPVAAAHMAPSAPAVASALFVAANEFTPDGEGLEAAAAAEQLLQVCTDAGCVNLAAALALLLGDQPALERFAGEHPAVWAELHGLIANDVHLCGFAPVLSPLPSPVVAGGGGAAAAALLRSAA